MKDVEQFIWENCKVRSTHLGYEDHGILTGWLHLEGSAWGQGFGGHNLTDPIVFQRFVQGVLAIFGDMWEHVHGRALRAGRVTPFGRVAAIRPLIDPYPIFYPEDLTVGDGIIRYPTEESNLARRS